MFLFKTVAIGLSLIVTRPGVASNRAALDRFERVGTSPRTLRLLLGSNCSQPCI